MRSLAVLPFQPLAGNARDQILESGMADALITKLGNIRQLTVRSTQSVLKYGGPAQDPLVAARELRVDALLVGGVQRTRDRIRLSVQLISARDGGVLWADKFDEESTAFEDAITTRVARALALRLTDAERARLARRDTNNPAALREYMIGRFYWHQFGPAVKQALQHFETAVVLDPSYALAHAGVADAYTSFASYRILSPRDAYPKARAAAEKALKLDPELSEAHSTLALVSLYHEWNWPDAERAFRRAVQLKPDNAEAHTRYALALAWFERFEEALAEIKQAGAVDPLLPRINANDDSDPVPRATL